MLCVVLGHVVDGYMAGNTYEWANAVMEGIYNLVYAFHMPLFMMISGYVYKVSYFSERNPDGKTRLHRQIWNCTAVYILYSVFWGLFKVMFNAFVNKSVSPTAILMIWAKPISPYWYLYELILFYVFFSMHCVRKLDCRVTFCLLLTVSIASSWITMDWFQLSGMCHYAIFFYLGTSIAGRSEPVVEKYKSEVFLITIAVLMEAICWYGSMSGSFGMNTVPILNVLAAGLISMALWQMFQRIGLMGNNRVLRLIGRYSLEIYVIHCFFTAGLRVVLPRIGVGNVWVSVALNTVVSTICPLLLSMLCRYLGIHDLFFRPITFLKTYSSRE